MSEDELNEIKKIYPEWQGIKRNYTKDETGNKYGKLTVLYRGLEEGTQRHARWICKCDCGNITSVSGRHLRDGEVSSCGKCRKTEYSSGTDFYKEQRSKMTPAFREKIKQRDNYTCQKCGLSIYDEPHLLLEVDHIIPISKGGMSTEDNLITLCWQCNRLKGGN